MLERVWRQLIFCVWNVRRLPGKAATPTLNPYVDVGVACLSFRASTAIEFIDIEMDHLLRSPGVYHVKPASGVNACVPGL